MHIRVTPARITPDKRAEADAVMRDLFAHYRQAGGFQGGYAASDPASGEGMAVTLWDSAAAAETATAQARAILARLAPLMADGQPPQPPRAHEVTVQG